MASYFGFVPPAEMQQLLNEAINLKTADGRPLHDLRKHLNDSILNNILDVLMVQLVEHLPENDKKETMLKLIHFLQGTVTKLMGTLLDHGKDETVKPSLEFSKRSLFKSPDGQVYFGMPLPDDFVKQITSVLDLSINGHGKENRELLKTHLIFLSDQLIHFFLNEYAHTLNLGLIKRKAVDIAGGAMTKMIHMTVHRLVDSLGGRDLAVMGNEYKKLFQQF